MIYTCAICINQIMSNIDYFYYDGKHCGVFTVCAYCNNFYINSRDDLLKITEKQYIKYIAIQ